MTYDNDDIALTYSGMEVHLSQFEGPLDLLLELARRQKVDLMQISVVELAEQYLNLITRRQELQLSVAAEYLLMAAWLTYLKSRLLLPQEQHDTLEESPQLQAERLAMRLRHLQKIRELSERLQALPQLGRDFFTFANPQNITTVKKQIYSDTLYDLLKAYSQFKMRNRSRELRIIPTDLYAPEQRVEPLRKRIATCPDWVPMETLLPPHRHNSLQHASAIAATLAASLELVRQGAAELQQSGNFTPLYVRRHKAPNR